VRHIPHFTGNHARIQNGQAARLIKLRSILIPQLNDVEALLGADRDALNGVFLDRCDAHHTTDRVPVKNINRVILSDADTVTAALDILEILPEGRNCSAHPEKHSTTPLHILKSIHECPELVPRRHGRNILKGLNRPLFLCRRMEI